MRLSKETLEARRALLARVDEMLHGAFRSLRGVSQDWAKNEGESLDVILAKQKPQK